MPKKGLTKDLVRWLNEIDEKAHSHEKAMWYPWETTECTECGRLFYTRNDARLCTYCWSEQGMWPEWWRTQTPKAQPDWKAQEEFVAKMIEEAWLPTEIEQKKIDTKQRKKDRLMQKEMMYQKLAHAVATAKAREEQQKLESIKRKEDWQRRALKERELQLQREAEQKRIKSEQDRLKRQKEETVLTEKQVLENKLKSQLQELSVKVEQMQRVASPPPPPPPAQNKPRYDICFLASVGFGHWQNVLKFIEQRKPDIGRYKVVFVVSDYQDRVGRSVTGLIVKILNERPGWIKTHVPMIGDLGIDLYVIAYKKDDTYLLDNMRILKLNGENVLAIEIVG
jgi:hypothetical protein